MSGRDEPVDWDAYLDAASVLIGIRIPAAHREATIAQLKLNAAIARPLIAFEMPEGTNPAPVFKW
jgi:hypothetical protein